MRDSDGTPVIYFYGLEFHFRNDDDIRFFNMIFQRLYVQWQVKNLPPELYPAVLEEKFYQRMGRPLNLNNPKMFTEKLQWIKIFDATPLKSRLADKFGCSMNIIVPNKKSSPKNFELMKKLAATLAEGFAFMRADFAAEKKYPLPRNLRRGIFLCYHCVKIFGGI